MATYYDDELIDLTGGTVKGPADASNLPEPAVLTSGTGNATFAFFQCRGGSVWMRQTGDNPDDPNEYGLIVADGEAMGVDGFNNINNTKFLKKSGDPKVWAQYAQ